MPKSFRRTPGQHCYCALSVKFRVSEFYSVVSSSETCHRSTVRPGALRSTSPPWPEHRTPSWMGAGVGGGEHRRSWHLLRWQLHSWRPTEDSASSQRRSAPPNAPLPSAWPHACQCTLQHRRGGPASIGRALCRRRARATPFRRIHPGLLIQARLAPKRNQWTSMLLPNLLNSPTKHCAAVTIAGDPRSRPPSRIANKKRSRARSRARTTTAPHQHPAKPLGGPRGGLLPQLQPPRSASATSSIHSGEAIPPPKPRQ